MNASAVNQTSNLVKVRAPASLVFGFLATLFFFSCASAQPLPAECGSLRPRDGWGPFDYRPEKYAQESTYGSHAARLAIVESVHFTPQVENLVRGTTAVAPGGDIAYTLTRFPNNHRALVAMARLADRRKNDKPDTSPYTIDCWFERALFFAPDDNLARLLYADFLSRRSRLPEAEQLLAIVVASIDGNSAITHNNIGLIYFEMQNFDKALHHAQKANELGMNNSAVRIKLEKAGKWLEPASQKTQGSEAVPVRP